MLSRSTEKLIEKNGTPASSKQALKAIQTVEARLARSKTLPAKKALLALKSNLLRTLAEYLRLDTLQDAENALLQSIKLDENDVVTLTTLAGLHLYQSLRFEEALHWAQRATICSDRQRKLVRLAYGTLCRAAIAANKPKLIEKSLRRLVEYVPNPNSDIALESDFVRRIPRNAVPPSLLRAYRRKIQPARVHRG